METPTIYEIKEAVKGYFFSRDTLKFFGQTLRQFKVVQSPEGNIFIYAPMHDGKRFMGFTFRQFADGQLKIIFPRPETLKEIKQYIKEH